MHVYLDDDRLEAQHNGGSTRNGDATSGGSPNSGAGVEAPERAGSGGAPWTAARLSRALSEASAQAKARGRIIVAAQLGDRELSSADLERMASGAWGSVAGDEGAGSLHLRSTDLREMVRLMLLETRDALEACREKQQVAAEALQVGDLAKATSELTSVLETWTLVRQVAGEVVALRARPAEQATEGWESAGVQSLSRVLGELKDAFGRGDLAAVADLLQFDLSDQAQTWSRLLQSQASPGTLATLRVTG
ncbi:MAG: hypothetical protein SFZ23_10150 [Planctomycetota bacterium]|nr:hypothetical protein [Planctomycetota bacterium]